MVPPNWVTGGQVCKQQSARQIVTSTCGNVLAATDSVTYVVLAYIKKKKQQHKIYFWLFKKKFVLQTMKK